MRRRQVLMFAVGMALIGVAAGCSSTAGHASTPNLTSPAVTGPGLAPPTTVAATALAGSSTTAVGSRPPVGTASMALGVADDIDLQVDPTSTPEGGPLPTVAAEGPDGAVFYASGDVIYVVDGDSPPVVALHPGAPVLAIGVGASALYVVTPSAVAAYSRSEGTQVHNWPLPSTPGPPTSAGVSVGTGYIWVWTDWATDLSGYQYATLYAIPSQADRATVISESMVPGVLVGDGTDAYFVEADGSDAGPKLVKWLPSASAPNGSKVIGPPAPDDASVSFSEGRIVLDNGTNITSFAPGPQGGSTEMVSSFNAAGYDVGLAGTDVGLLVLTCPGGTSGCPRARVDQVDPLKGVITSSLDVPGAIGPVIGPAPVVFATEAGHLHLIRLAGSQA